VEAGFMLKYLQPLAEEKYRDAYTAHAEDVSAPGCATSLPKAVWDRGSTIEEQRKAKLPAQPEWLDTLPGAYAGSHIAGILISVGAPGLKPLHELRAKLASGELEAPKP
jgi:hypothetical protein